MTESSLIISEFNAVDMGILALLALSALIGVIRGFTREIFGIAGWVGAVLVTLWGMPLLKPFMRDWVGNPLFADIISVLGLFIVSFVTFMTLIRAMSDRVKSSILGSLDRSLGLLFGIIRGSILIILLFLASNIVWKPEKRPPLLLAAKSYPFLLNGTESFLSILPKGMIPTSVFKSREELPHQLLENPDQLMQALSQPKRKESDRNKAEGYRTQHRHSMDRLIQNYKAEDEA